MLKVKISFNLVKFCYNFTLFFGEIGKKQDGCVQKVADFGSIAVTF